MKATELRPQDIERFWGYTQKSDGCWTWTGFVDNHGYGKFNLRLNGERKSRHAHRIAYALTYGEIPNDLCACHHCDNPICVRPDHLFLGTNADNTADMMRKGRFKPGKQVRGGGAHRAKLTDGQALEIIELYATGNYRQKDLGAMYGVTQSTVHLLVAGKNWSHISDNPVGKGGRIGRPSGVNHPQAKFTSDQLQEIRRRTDDGERQIALAREFGVTRETIRNITTGKCYQQEAALYAAETDPATKKAIKALGARLVKERDELRGSR